VALPHLRRKVHHQTVDPGRRRSWVSARASVATAVAIHPLHLQMPNKAATPPAAEDEEEDDQSIIEFEADFGDEDDPLNDINIHKQQISRIPRGPRPALSALPPNPTPHNDVVQGVNQQPLPFNPAAGKNAEKKYPTMEPLAPNPLQKNKVHNQAEAALIGSPWKLPDTAILNNPEDVKLQMLGDDTSTIGKDHPGHLTQFPCRG